MREYSSLFKKLPTSTFPSPPVFLPPYPGSMESLPQPTASFFFQLPTKVKNQCESLKKESTQRTESQAKAPGCRLRKKLPLGKDLLPGFARLFFLGQTVLEANNRVAEEPVAAGFIKSCSFVHVKEIDWNTLIKGMCC